MASAPLPTARCIRLSGSDMVIRAPSERISSLVSSNCAIDRSPDQKQQGSGHGPGEAQFVSVRVAAIVVVEAEPVRFAFGIEPSRCAMKKMSSSLATTASAMLRGARFEGLELGGSGILWAPLQRGEGSAVYPVSRTRDRHEGRPKGAWKSFETRAARRESNHCRRTPETPSPTASGLNGEPPDRGAATNHAH
jgi:hypothetical protein